MFSICDKEQQTISIQANMFASALAHDVDKQALASLLVRPRLFLGALRADM